MRMRRTLPHLLALLLGVGAALLAACGQGTRGGIPAADASDLKRELEDVRARVAEGRCDELSGQLRQVNTRIDQLPRSVDARLIEALRDGADRLRRRSVKDCNANNITTETQTAPTVTQTVTTETTTTPTDTTTTPTDTTTAPTDTTGTVETLPAEPPPPPSGGISPEVP